MNEHPCKHDFEAMQQHVDGLPKAAMLYCVARYNIADELSSGPKTAQELGRLTGLDSMALESVLRYLEYHGIFKEGADGKFHNTALSSTLRHAVDGSLHSRALRTGDEWWFRTWPALGISLETGNAAFDQVHGMTFWEYMNKNEEAAMRFNTRRNRLSQINEVPEILSAFDFGAFKSVLDIGAGYGSLLIGILEADPTTTGAWFDLPHAEKGVRQFLEDKHLADRCAVITGDFMEQIPCGYDLLVLKEVLHNWNRDAVVRLLRNCKAAMHKDARLLIIDQVLTPESPAGLRFGAIMMLVMFGGGYRSEEEYCALVRDAGLKHIRTIYTPSHGTALMEVAVG